LKNKNISVRLQGWITRTLTNNCYLGAFDFCDSGELIKLRSC